MRPVHSESGQQGIIAYGAANSGFGLKRQPPIPPLLAKYCCISDLHISPEALVLHPCCNLGWADNFQAEKRCPYPESPHTVVVLPWL